jgi:sugar phosphate isomerase/epimerase
VADRVLFCAKHRNFQACIDLACDHGAGIEVQTFAYPTALDTDWKTLVQHYQQALRHVPGEIAMHGPFMDMASGSLDPWIDQVVRQRVEQALDIAAELGAVNVIFHANFIASMRNIEYRIGWTDRQVTFWGPLAERARELGQVIALENMWEFDPDIIRDVITKVDMPSLQACLDIGHTRLFSEVPARDWIASLNGHLVHAHLNNNEGVVDVHHALVDGVLDYKPLLESLRQLPNPPAFSLEIEQIDDIIRSLPLLNI